MPVTLTSNLSQKIVQRRNSRWGKLQNWLAGSLALSTCALGCWVQPVRAEGSRELTNNGGVRPYLDYRIGGAGNTFFTGGIPRNGPIKAFVRAGETLYLGSSAVGRGGRIDYIAPNGTTGTCTVGGQIVDRAQEQVGPVTITAGGYTPCIITPAQTTAAGDGIWDVRFISPNPGSAADPPALPAASNWTQSATVSWVAAWDVTVANGVTPLAGRVFANYLPLNIGANSQSLNAQTFIQTVDGYRYRLGLNGIDPFGFIFFANNRGFTNGTGGAPLFRSVLAPGGTLPAGVDVQRPFEPDTPDEVTHKIFFNSPDAGLPASANSPSGFTWLLVAPTPPPTINSFAFTGIDGTPGQGGTPAPPLAPGASPPAITGNFTFNSSTAGAPYTIAIDVNQNGIFGDGNDRVLQGISQSGVNTVPWDGLDGNGATIPPSTIGYGAALFVGAGEVHFPFIDAENNNTGIIIQRLVPPGNIPIPLPGLPLIGDPFTIYYDDSPLTGAGGSNPIKAPTGISSQGGGHGYSSNFGDERGIDTWTRVPSPPVALAQGLRLAQADLVVAKSSSPNPFVPGTPVTYTVVVTNNGPDNAAGETVTDTVPPIISGVSWTCAITTGTGSCGAASGTGNNISTTVNLNNGAVATYTITGTLSPTATGFVENTASVARARDTTDPNLANNSALNRTPIGPAVPRIGLAKQAGDPVNNGDGSFTVPYTFTVRNSGSTPLSSLQITEDLSPTFAGTTSFAIVSPPSSSNLTGNPGFNGSTDTRLLAGTDTLAIGATATVTFTARVVTGGKLGPFNNTAIVAGTPPAGATPVTDVSTDGVSPDPDNDGNPGNNTIPTVVDLNTAPRLRLVKRITAVTRSGVSTNFNNFVDDPSDANDTAPGWAQLPPVGLLGIDSTNPLRSGDELEYTIYFLSDGTRPALTTNLCDPVPANTSFLPDTFGAGLGVAVNQAGTTTPRTNQADADSTTVLSPLAPLPANNACPDQTNSNGSVTVNLGDLSNTAGSNFGFTRFRVRID